MSGKPVSVDYACSDGTATDVSAAVMAVERARLSMQLASTIPVPVLPLAIVLLIVTIVHVTVAFLFGYVWIFGPENRIH